jgi:hypothetical protein
VNFAQYLDLISRLGIRRAEIDLFLMMRGDEVPPARLENMKQIAELLGETDYALYQLQRRVELLAAELHNRDLELKKSQKRIDQLIQTII